MKTFFTKLNDFFSGNNEEPAIRHTEDSAEGDEGIDNFSFEEDPKSFDKDQINENGLDESLDPPQNE